MKKSIVLIVAIVASLSLGSLAFAAYDPYSDMPPPPVTLKGATFFFHMGRPEDPLEGPSFVDRRTFDNIFKGNDTAVGLIAGTNGESMMRDNVSGCYYTTDDKNAVYHLSLIPGDSDSYYGFSPKINFLDGSTIEAPFSYVNTMAYSGKCAIAKARSTIINKLKFVGNVEGVGLKVYELKSPYNSSHLKKMYKDATTYGSTFQDYVTEHPLIYVDDGFGMFHELMNGTFAPAAEMGKPAVYLYPEKEQNFNVKVTPIGGKITVEIPALVNSAWNVTANPTGEIKTGGKTFDYLFYESTTNQPMAITKGTVVAQKDIASVLPKMLDKIGFKAGEKKEFLDYWLPRMNSKPYYVLQFMFNGELDQYSRVEITPSLPLYRVFLNFKGVDKPVSIAPQTLTTLDRTKPHAFEWGGNNLAK